MSRLPSAIRKRLQQEATEWDVSIKAESPENVKELLEQAEIFEVPRPARRAVSFRMDPADISMLKRIARKRGIPYTQLIAMWLHEKIEQESAKGKG
jgi:predicted DNA binding CopG/RHH family protein